MILFIQELTQLNRIVTYGLRGGGGGGVGHEISKSHIFMHLSLETQPLPPPLREDVGHTWGFAST